LWDVEVRNLWQRTSPISIEKFQKLRGILLIRSSQSTDERTLNMPLHPQCAAFLAEAAKANLPEIAVMGATQARATGHTPRDFSGPLRDDVSITTRYITTPTADVVANIYHLLVRDHSTPWFITTVGVGFLITSINMMRSFKIWLCSPTL